METDIVCPLSTGQVILEATRRVQDPELVRTALGDLDRALVLSSNPLLRAQTIALSPPDGFVLSRIDGLERTRGDGLVPLPPDDVERSLFGLLCTGIVDYRRESTSASRAGLRMAARAAARQEPAGDGRRPRAHSVRAGDASARHAASAGDTAGRPQRRCRAARRSAALTSCAR